MKLTSQSLDALLPLQSASHDEVVSLGVDTPMRYSECFATLGNGDRVRLGNGQQFLGWSGSSSRRKLYFRAGEKLIVVTVDQRRRRPIRQIACWSQFRCHAAMSLAGRRSQQLDDPAEAVIARDGSLQLVVPQAAQHPEWIERAQTLVERNREPAWSLSSPA